MLWFNQQTTFWSEIGFNEFDPAKKPVVVIWMMSYSEHKYHTLLDACIWNSLYFIHISSLLGKPLTTNLKKNKLRWSYLKTSKTSKYVGVPFSGIQFTEKNSKIKGLRSTKSFSVSDWECHRDFFYYKEGIEIGKTSRSE